jgi:hypothetical protein
LHRFIPAKQNNNGELLLVYSETQKITNQGALPATRAEEKNVGNGAAKGSFAQQNYLAKMCGSNYTEKSRYDLMGRNLS